MDWRAWHADYEDPDSALGRRLALVRGHVRAAVDRAAPGPVRAISVCAGQGQDLLRPDFHASQSGVPGAARG
jgi:hypothetical protein